MSALHSTLASVFVRELEDGQAVDQALLVREAQRRSTRAGSDYLRLVLADRTGTLDAVLWECAEELFALATPGVVVRVKGHYSVHERFGPQVKVVALRAATPEEYDLADLLDGPARDVDQMERDLRELVGTIQNRHLRRLLDVLIGPGSALWPAFRAAPAAKYYHQAYRHGLLEHCMSVAQGVSVLARGPFRGGVDRDLAVTGALLHDIGKTEVYAMSNGAIELTDRGKLLGEIPIGYYLVRREIERIEGFPVGDAEGLLHIILSHHGKLEHGSPVVPCTREATLVHFVDNLGGNLGSFDRIERTLADGARWSDFDRGISASAYFGERAA
jgi:3'-5' exoribonuclease